MAFNESLKQKVDLLGMADLLARQQSASRNQKNQTSGMADQAGMQQLLQWGIPATEDNLRKLRGGFISAGQDTMTLQDPMLKGTNIGSSKTFLSDLPGYISGTPGAQVSAERNAAAQAMIGAMGQSAAAASRGGASPSETAQNVAQTNLLDEQARRVAQERSGYGSGAASLLAEQESKNKAANDRYKIDTQAATDLAVENIKQNSAGYDDLLKNAKQNSAAGSKVIAAGDKKIEESKKLAEGKIKELNSVRQDLYKNKVYQGLSAEKKQEIKDKIVAIYEKMNGDVDINDVVNFYASK